ncbi:MAG TPA: DEAD/DEAH box helicase [Aggregatilineaceae bacterium]|jgi:ATP-dependent RNA helicase RhlE|nr:DEAD/DEAH box helicase [Aggregatilineaceae bacterium]
MSFQELQLIDPLLRAVDLEGYTEPTPIQAQAIPYILAGRDVLGCAQTGTGKTAAFALPILQRLAAGRTDPHPPYIRALILSPTRELATQIGDSFAAYGRHTRLKHTVVYGGVGQSPQVKAVQRGVDILVATPGRLLDLMGQGLIRLEHVEVFVLDEGDRMLDMGFIHDVRRIIRALPARRQTLLFSATMPPAVQELVRDMLVDPVKIEVVPQATPVAEVTQAVFFVEKDDKRALLEYLLRDAAITRALVFTRTKYGADKLAKQLKKARVNADAIHGNKSQGAREQALHSFKSGATRVLIATDIVARGIDVENISHVINYDLPNEPESYVHRIGRTARAGSAGVAYSFCAADERKYLQDIERLIRMRVTAVPEHPYTSPLGIPAPTDLRPKNESRQASRGGSRRSRGRQRSGDRRRLPARTR